MKKVYTHHTQVNFSGFEKRETLQNIWRYSLYDNVWYRSNVWDHSIRVFYMILAIKDEVIDTFPHIDFSKV